MFIPFVDKIWKPLVALTLFNSVISLYLVNDADSASADSKSTVLYALNVFGVVTSVMMIMGDNPFTDGGDVEDDYYYSDNYYDDEYSTQHVYTEELPSDYYDYYGYYY